MKRAALLLSTLFAILLLGAFVGMDNKTEGLPENEGGINWITMAELEAMEAKEPRKVFVDVYTNWCGWCKKMDKSTFADPEVVEYVNENYYAVKLNAESRETISFKGYQVSEAEIARSLKVSGYPTIVFIDEKIESIQPVPGYRTAKEFKKMLASFNK